MKSGHGCPAPLRAVLGTLTVRAACPRPEHRAKRIRETMIADGKERSKGGTYLQLDISTGSILLSTPHSEEKVVGVHWQSILLVQPLPITKKTMLADRSCKRIKRQKHGC